MITVEEEDSKLKYTMIIKDGANALAGDYDVVPPISYGQHGEHLTVIEVDLDVDSNNDGSIADTDDSIEENSPGFFICTNNNDSNTDGTIDNSDTTFESSDLDIKDMSALLKPESMSLTDGHAFIKVLTPNRLRIFKGAAELVSPTETDEVEITPFNDVNGSSELGLKFEGIEAGEVEVELIIKNGTTEICKDKVKITVVKVGLSGLSEIKTFPKRTGTAFAPVIEIVSGGQDDALYGVVDENTNVFTFKARAKSSSDAKSSIGYFNPTFHTYKWTLNGGTITSGSATSQIVTVEYSSPGRYFPKLEVLTVTSPIVTVGKAEIHSIVIEQSTDTNINVVAQTSTWSSTKIFGKKVTARWIENESLVFDIRLKIDAKSGARGRVSLDGYPQCEYWSSAADSRDLAQVVQVKKTAPVNYYIQSYGNIEVTDMESKVDVQIKDIWCETDKHLFNIKIPTNLKREDVSVHYDSATGGYQKRQRFLYSLLTVKANGLYDAFPIFHNAVTLGTTNAVHGNPWFLPWHRQFIADLENKLKEIDPCVRMIYWDWTKAENRSSGSNLWDTNFLGGTGFPVISGIFAHRMGCWDAPGYPGGKIDRDLGGEPVPHNTLGTADEVARSLAEPVYDKSPWESQLVDGFRNWCEGFKLTRPLSGAALHNLGHVWVGGTMLEGVSPGDPAFFLHHCYVDYIWAQWQNAHPTQSYLPGSTGSKYDIDKDMTPSPYSGPKKPSDLLVSPEYDPTP